MLPFLLRRVKEDVLKELPPKITQDYYCELSALQRRLYEDFSRQHMPHDISAHTHVFQVHMHTERTNAHRPTGQYTSCYLSDVVYLVLRLGEINNLDK